MWQRAVLTFPMWMPSSTTTYPRENEHYTHRIGRTGRARKQGASYLFYTKEEQKRVDQLLRLTRNTDDCKSVKFDFNHEHLKIEDTAPADKFQIKAYF